MGLDVYVGPLSRYLRGDWKVQQAGEPVTAEPIDAEHATTVVSQWVTALAEALGGSSVWSESADAPYETDKPDWDGYGGLVLLAAFAEHPTLADWELPAVNFSTSAALAATTDDTRFATILSGVTWWLPLDSGPVSFQTGGPGGSEIRIGWLSSLADELRLLLSIYELSDHDLRSTRAEGPPELGSPAMAAGRFGLAVMVPLARDAVARQLPLVLDY